MEWKDPPPLPRRLTVYSAPHCPWCREAKEYLRSRSVKFEEHDVTRDMGALQQLISISNQSKVPVFTCGDRVMIGFDRYKLDELIDFVEPSDR